MNCKPDQLVFVATPGVRRHTRPNLGRVFTVTRLATMADFPIPVDSAVFDEHGPIWVIEGGTYGWVLYDQIVEWNLAPDFRLKPLLGGEGADETLAWAPVPATPIKELA